MLSVKITYRGWAGHYILSDRCLFRLNTLLECGTTKIVVSTVGACRNHTGNGFIQIGLNRFYETMVFHAKFVKPYWDVDVSREISVQSDCAWPKLGDELKAQRGHEKVVEEIAGKLARGEKLGE